MQKTKGEFPPSGNPTLFNIEIGKALFLGSTPVNNISIATRPVWTTLWLPFFSRPAKSQHKGDIAHLSAPDGHKLDSHRLRDTHSLKRWDNQNVAARRGMVCTIANVYGKFWRESRCRGGVKVHERSTDTGSHKCPNKFLTLNPDWDSNASTWGARAGVENPRTWLYLAGQAPTCPKACRWPVCAPDPALRSSLCMCTVEPRRRIRHALSQTSPDRRVLVAQTRQYRRPHAAICLPPDQRS